MEQLYIVCIDDQREVLNSLLDALEPFEKQLIIEATESADEAWEVIDEIDAMGDHLALIISDHVMPGKTGVEFLKEVVQDGRFPETRKILLTGLATHKDTIEAINEGGIDNYIEKPWTRTNLQKIVKTLLTQYILKEGIDYNKFMELLDQETLYAGLRNRPGGF